MGTAGLSGRYPASAALTGADQVRPRSTEVCTSACSWLIAPSGQVSTIVLVAPAPVGAPLAMLRLGKLSVRVPANPSNTIRPDTGSGTPTSCTVAIARGFSKLSPPSNERARKKTVWAVLVAALSWRWRQVPPPSVEESTIRGSGKKLALRKATLQR